MIFHNPENSGDSGSTSIPDVFPPCFNTNMFDSKLLSATFKLEASVADDGESRYLSASYKTVAVRYRFLPAILMEFPSDDYSD